MSGSATDDLLAKSKLLRQRLEARQNTAPTAASHRNSSNSMVAQPVRGPINQITNQNDPFPLLIGNLEERRSEESTFTKMILLVMTLIALPFVLPLLPFVFLYNVFQQQRYKREYAQNILNPEYLRGTGLFVASDLSAELITKGKVPRYTFKKEDITSINRHAIQYGMSSSKDYEIRIYLHDFHALTLYGLTGVEPRDIVDKLVSLYGVEVHDTSEYVDTSSGGGGGG